MSSPIIKTPFRCRNRLANGKENNLSREIKELKRRLEDEIARGEDLEMESKSKEETINRLKEELEVCKVRLRSLNDTLATMVTSEEYDKLKSNFDELKNKFESHAYDLKFNQNCVKDLEDELKTAYTSNHELNNKLDTLMKDMENVAKEYIEYNQLKAKYEDLTEKSKVIMEENEELRRSLDSLREHIRRDISDNSMSMPLNFEAPQSAEPVSLFSEIMLKEREEELEKSKKSNENLKSEVEELRGKVRDVEKLEQENQALTAQKALLMEQVRDFVRDRESFHSKREGERQRSHDKIKQLQEKVNQREEEIAKLKSERKEERKENEKLRNQIEDLQREIKVLDMSFNFERRTKERILRENQHLEHMLKEEQFKMSQTSQGVQQPLIDSNSIVLPKIPAHKIKAPQSDSSLQSKPPVETGCNSMRSDLITKEIKPKGENTDVSKNASSIGADSNVPYQLNNSRRPVPPGTGRTLPMADEEGEFMDQGHLIISDSSTIKNANGTQSEDDFIEDPYQRFSVLQSRNTRVLPHLKSSYPVEFQDVSVPENAIKQKGPLPKESEMEQSFRTSFKNQPPSSKQSFSGFFDIPPPERKRSNVSSRNSNTLPKSAPKAAPKPLTKSTTFTISFK